MLKKMLILVNSLYPIYLTDPAVLNYLPYYDQLARVHTYKRNLEGLLARNHALIFSLDCLVCLIPPGPFLGRKTRRSVALTSLVLANLALYLPLLYEAVQVLIF